MTVTISAALILGAGVVILCLRSPVILDEWQEVPELLGAVKRLVDEDPAPGRYILTGSVRAELENRIWPGTGRLLQVPCTGCRFARCCGEPAWSLSSTGS